MRRNIAHSAVARYVIAVLSVTAAVVLALCLVPVVLVAAQLLLVAILITGWVGGLRPALVALVLATFPFAYYFTPPLEAPNSGLTAIARVGLFIVIAGFMATMSAARRQAEHSFRRTSEELEIRVRDRTADLRRANERLNVAAADAVAAQQRFLDLVNSVEGIVWEADATTFAFSFVSNQAERILGFPAACWLSEPTFWTDHLHPDDRDWVVAARENATSEERNHDFEYRMIAADGHVVWLRDLATVVPDHEHATRLRGVMVDITASRRADAALREQAGLLDLTHDAIFVRDMNDVVTYWNRAAEEFYGWTAAQAVGKVAQQLTRSVLAVPSEQIRAALLGADRWEGEVVQRLADGRQVVVASRWSLRRDEQGRPRAILETNNDITKRKEAEAKLRESEQRYRDIFESIEVAICEEDFSQVKVAIDDLKSRGLRGFREYCAEQPEFVQRAIAMVKVVDVNRAAVRLFAGASKEQVLVSLDKVVLPETREAVVNVLCAIAEGLTSFEAETVVQTLKGAKLTVLFTLTLPAPPARLDRVLVTVVDITQRKRAEYLAEHVFEACPDRACIIGRDYRYQRVNRAFERYWRMPAGKGVGMHVADVFGVELFEERIKANLDGCFAGEDVSYADWLATTHGRRYTAVSYSPLRPDPAERVNAALMISRDLTEHMVASEALRRAQTELAHVTRVATLGELAASIGHEVNQPLAAIIADASASLNRLAAADPDLDKVREALEAIVEAGHRAADVIQRIRQLATRTEPQKAAVNINDLIRDVLRLVHIQLLDHHVSLHLDLTPVLAPVLADRVQLQQVIMNLVVNGVEAMAPVEDRPRKLLIRSRPHGGNGVTVAVQDTGLGIDAKDIDELFGAFFTTKPGGMGMGLSISRSIIEAHGGRLWATSNSDHGATFHFSLPGIR